MELMNNWPLIEDVSGKATSFGIVGVPNVTITAFTTPEEEAELHFTDTGRRYPATQVVNRRKALVKNRLNLKTVSIFPV